MLKTSEQLYRASERSDAENWPYYIRYYNMPTPALALLLMDELNILMKSVDSEFKAETSVLLRKIDGSAKMVEVKTLSSILVKSTHVQKLFERAKKLQDKAEA